MPKATLRELATPNNREIYETSTTATGSRQRRWTGFVFEKQAQGGSATRKREDRDMRERRQQRAFLYRLDADHLL